MLCQYILLATFSLSASAFSIPKSSTSPVPSILNNVKAAPQNNVLPNVLPNQLVFQSQLEPINKPIRLPPFAIEQVRLLGQFASVSSCDPTEWKCGLRCEGATAGTKLIDTFYHDRTSTFAYVAVNDEHRRIIVSFRGTVDVAAGAQDLRIIKTSISWLENKDAMVHTGFLSCYNSIRDNITETVKNTAQDYPEYTLTFLGHSLGGAVATLAALDARYTMPQMEQQLVTFGAPRVGNPEFAKLANQQLYRPANDRTGGFLPNSIRVVNYNDLIPQLFTRLINYQHYGPEVWISTAMNDKAVLCYPHQDQENEHCSNSVYAETDPVLELKRHRVYLGVDMEQDRQCVAYSPNYRWLTKAAIYAFNKLYQYLQSKA